jgi:hypothetical protein
MYASKDLMWREILKNFAKFLELNSKASASTANNKQHIQSRMIHEIILASNLRQW